MCSGGQRGGAGGGGKRGEGGGGGEGDLWCDDCGAPRPPPLVGDAFLSAFQAHFHAQTEEEGEGRKSTQPFSRSPPLPSSRSSSRSTTRSPPRPPTRSSIVGRVGGMGGGIVGGIVGGEKRHYGLYDKGGRKEVETYISMIDTMACMIFSAQCSEI